MGWAPSLVTTSRSLLNGVHLGKGGGRLSKGTTKRRRRLLRCREAPLACLLNCIVWQAGQQGEQSATAQQHWQGACRVRGPILCEPERRCQDQGGVGSEEDRAGKQSNKDENSDYSWGSELELPGKARDQSSSMGVSKRRMAIPGFTKSPVGDEGHESGGSHKEWQQRCGS